MVRVLFAGAARASVFAVVDKDVDPKSLTEIVRAVAAAQSAVDERQG